MKHIIRKVLKESDDLNWIKDVSGEIPSLNERFKINLSEMFKG